MPTAMPEEPFNSNCGIRRQHQRLLLGSVVVVDEVDGVGVDILQQGFLGKSGEAALGVAHGRRRVVVDGAEVAVPVHQALPHGEVLGHAHQGFVNRLIPVGMVFPDHIPHDAGALAKRAIRRQAQLVHSVEDAAMHRLEAVAGIRQSPPDNHAHGVFQVGLRHLPLQVGGDDARGQFVVAHGWG